MTAISSSLFQSATVLTKNEFLYCSVLLSGIFNFKPQEFRIFLSGKVVVRTAVVKGGWTYSSSTSVCWCQDVFWGHGWDVALRSVVEGCQPLLLPTFL